MGLNETWTPAGLSGSLCFLYCSTLAWHWFDKAISCLCPLCLSTIRPLAWKSRESCRVSCKGSVTPAHHFPPLPAGKPPRGGDSVTHRCAAGLAPAEQCKPCGGFLPSEAQEGHHFLLLCKLWKAKNHTIRCLFLVLTFLKLAWNCLVNLWGVVDTFTDPLPLGKGLKIWCYTGLSHLSLL